MLRGAVLVPVSPWALLQGLTHGANVDVIASRDSRHGAKLGYSLKSWMAAFLMAQQGELSPRSARATIGVACRSSAAPSPAPRTNVCSTCRAHT